MNFGSEAAFVCSMLQYAAKTAINRKSDQPQDVAQEAVMIFLAHYPWQSWMKRKQNRRIRLTLRRCVLTVVRNFGRSEHHNHVINPKANEATSHVQISDPSAGLDRAHCANALKCGFTRLSADEQFVLLQRAHGVPISELAEALNVSQATISRKHKIALSILKRECPAQV